MRFEELDIKSVYDSRRISVHDEFFNKILPHCGVYRRFGGIFSAYRFALIAEGLQDFIKENNGSMELAIIPVISKDDKKALLQGISIDDVVTRNWIRDLSEIREKFVENHKMALSWMIANQFLTVKLVMPQHQDGSFMIADELRRHPILHREIGIFYNIENQKSVSFHGIIDRESFETDEFYSIDVSRSWIDGERDRIEKDHEEFANFWDNKTCEFGNVKFQIRPLTVELESYFEKTAPKTKEQIPTLQKLPVLRPYQKTAIAEWVKNGHRGIFEMATGAGKTFTGIGCIREVQSREEVLLVVIAVPYRHLIDQWRKELSKWSISSTTLDSGEWSQILRDEIYFLNTGSRKTTSVLITSHNLFKDEKFAEQIKLANVPVMLIADEAHHIGTHSSQRGLSSNYSHRLALSATIDRYFDGDGTLYLKNYFGQNGRSTVFEFSLKKALDERMLCQYYYYPSFIELTEDELVGYRDLTRKAAILLDSKDLKNKIRGERLLQKRARIIRDAENKRSCLKEMLRSMDHLSRLLIFCSEKQFNWLEDILHDLSKHCGIEKSPLFRRITHNSPAKKKDRIKILQEFADEEWDILLANMVLDEGMDMPQVQNCIVLASTGNPTRFIQRRGRVLRMYDGVYKDGTTKKFARIYDILVKPQIDNLNDPNAIKLEISMIRNQLRRLKSMGELAINSDECTKKILEFTYSLPLEIFDIDK